MAISFFVFYPAVSCGFLNWDDDWMLIDNPLVKSLSLANLSNLFFGEIYMMNYQPLVFLSYAVEYHFFGLDPRVFHFSNIILHLLNVVLVYVVLRELSGNSAIALIACALFAIHPMRVESVAWVTTRRDVLYSFFYLFSILQYLKYLRADGNKSTRYYVLAIVLFIFSCLSKGMAVTLTATIVLLDIYERRPITRVAILDKIPFLLISLFFGLLAIYATHTEAQIKEYSDHTFIERIQYAGYAFVFYLFKPLAPVDLSLIYPYPYLTGKIPLYYWGYVLLAIGVISGVIFSLKYTRKIIFGFGFFAISVFFILQLLPVYNALVADRYTYMASIGLAYLAAELYIYWTTSTKKANAIFRALPQVVLAGTLIFFAYQSHARIAVWQNSLTIWNDVIAKQPRCAKAYLERGNAKSELKDYHGAIHDYSRSILLDPNDPMAYNIRGVAKKNLGKTDEALEDYQRAMEIDNDYAMAYSNIGVVHFEKGDFSEAITSFSQAVDLNPDNSKHYLLRGNTKYMQWLYKEAIIDYDMSVELNPYVAEVYFFRANSHYSLLAYENACTDWEKAMTLGYTEASKMIDQHCGESGQGNATNSNLYYKNGQLKVEVLREIDSLQGKDLIRYFSEEGSVIEQGIIVNGKYDGWVRWYYPSGKLLTTGFYRDSIPFGDWREYYIGSQLKAQYGFVDGAMHGSYTYYHENGLLWTERLYTSGKLMEIISNQTLDGVALDKGSLHNGTGDVRVYNENGDFIEALHYKDGIQLDIQKLN